MSHKQRPYSNRGSVCMLEFRFGYTRLLSSQTSKIASTNLVQILHVHIHRHHKIVWWRNIDQFCSNSAVSLRSIHEGAEWNVARWRWCCWQCGAAAAMRSFAITTYYRDRGQRGDHVHNRGGGGGRAGADQKEEDGRKAQVPCFLPRHRHRLSSQVGVSHNTGFPVLKMRSLQASGLQHRSRTSKEHKHAHKILQHLSQQLITAHSHSRGPFHTVYPYHVQRGHDLRRPPARPFYHWTVLQNLRQASRWALNIGQQKEATLILG